MVSVGSVWDVLVGGWCLVLLWKVGMKMWVIGIIYRDILILELNDMMSSKVIVELGVDMDDCKVWGSLWGEDLESR